MSGTTEIPLCDPYVWEDPRYLFRSSWLDRYLNRRHGVCASELVNEIIFVYIFSVLFGIVVSVLTNLGSAPLFAGLGATIFLIPTFLKLRTVQGFRTDSQEGFQTYFKGSRTITTEDDDPDSLLKAANEFKGEPEGITENFVVAQPDPDFNEMGVVLSPDNPFNTVLKHTTTIGVVGAPRNPFNNVLMNEIAYAPTRPEAPDITTRGARVALDDFFRVQWYSDPTDIFGKSQSQREFITQPSTSIPNDQKSYQNWLYRIPGKTCKEGNKNACYGGTNGGALPWLNL